MLSRLTGFLRDLCFAFTFGTHEALAAFLIAFRFAHLARRLFGEGSLQTAFVPLFEEIRQEGMEKSCRFFRDLYAAWILLVSLVCVISITALLAWKTWGEPDRSTVEILDLALIIIPSLLPICLFGLNISFLQCQKAYFVAGASPIFFNIVLITTTLFLRSTTPQAAMPLCALAVILASMAQWGASFVPVYRDCKATLGKELFHKIALLSPTVKRIWKPIALGLIGIGATQINNGIDLIFARIADPEGPAHLWYSVRFQQLPLALFGIALSSALLPPLSRAIQSGNQEQYRTFLDYAIRKVIAFLAPCTGALIVLGMALIHGLYGYGGFSLHAVVMTTGCLHGYALSLIPMGLIIIFANGFYAKKIYTIPVRGAYISLFCNLLCNTIMVYGFGWKAISVCIATSISAWLNALYLYWELKKEMGAPLTSRLSSLKTLGAVLASSVVTYVAMALFFSPPILFTAFTTSVSLPVTFVDKMIHIIYPGAFFALSLFAFAVLFKAEDLLALVNMVTKRTQVQPK